MFLLGPGGGPSERLPVAGVRLAVSRPRVCELRGERVVVTVREARDGLRSLSLDVENIEGYVCIRDSALVD